MVTKKTMVRNPSGLHARPASIFVKRAMEFASDIEVRNVTTDSEPKNAKSILSLMGLGLKQGNEIEVIASGQDERDAVEALIELVDSGCGE
ncbi:HPr family phosphocarrier protein [Enorma massiliensis]|uniref:HPr family phosphocarrier protein n=1 Tax=Enorma massiliensis TaxID=1472761 RepID=UPI003A95D364